jgi:hypothetical protein
VNVRLAFRIADNAAVADLERAALAAGYEWNDDGSSVVDPDGNRLEAVRR